MHIIKKISHILNSVEKLQYARMTYNASTYENNLRVLGWMKYRHGPNLRNARKLAKSRSTNALPVSVTPMALLFGNLPR